MSIITFDIPIAIMWGIEMCIIFQYLVPREKRLKGKSLLKFLLTLITLAFIADKINEPFRMIILFSAVSFILKSFYKLTISKSIITYIMQIFLEIFTIFIYVYITLKKMGISSQTIRYNLMHRFIIYFFIVFNSILIINLFIFIRKKYFLSKKRNQLQIIVRRLWNEKINYIMYLAYGITIFILGILNKFAIQYTNKNNFIILNFAPLTLLILGLLIIFLQRSFIAKKIELEHQKREYEQLKIYADIIEGLSKDLRKHRHDFNNILFALRGFIDNKDIDGIKRYFYSVILKEQEFINNSNAIFFQLQNISDLALKGLLTTKINRAMNLGLKVQLSIIEKVGDIPVETIDLCKMTGILLDNAIEAAVETDEKVVSIALMNEKDNISLIIGNSYNKKPDIEKIFTEGYSTKGQNRGLGLKTLRDIVYKKYKNIKLKTLVDENFFIQEMIFTSAK